MHNCPTGYPQLSAFLTSDDDLSIYRRFAYVHSRLILKKQDELRQLEDALDGLDAARGDGQANTVWFDLELEFNEYGEFP